MRHFFENRNWKPDLGVLNDEKGPFGRLGRVTAAKKLDHILVVVSVLVLLDKALAVLRNLVFLVICFSKLLYLIKSPSS